MVTGIENMSGLARTLSAVLIIVSIALCGPVLAHSGEDHSDKGVLLFNNSSSLTNEVRKLPLDRGGPFTLMNHHRQIVSADDYLGKYMLVFFGYTQCKNMCSLSLRRIGQALQLMDDDHENLSVVMVTVDPERDTPEQLQSELVKYHPQIIGHTGSEEQLSAAYAAYNQEPLEVEPDWNGDPTVSHQSYIFLMGPDGRLRTLFPPILNPQSMAKIVQKYLGSNG